MGNHDELLANDGLYSRLHKVQFRVPDNDKDEVGHPAMAGLQHQDSPGDGAKIDEIVGDKIDLTDDWSGSSDS